MQAVLGAQILGLKYPFVAEVVARYRRRIEHKGIGKNRLLGKR